MKIAAGPHLEGVLIVRGPKLPKTDLGGRSTDDPTGDSTLHTSSWSMCIFNSTFLASFETFTIYNIKFSLLPYLTLQKKNISFARC